MPAQGTAAAASLKAYGRLKKNWLKSVFKVLTAYVGAGGPCLPSNTQAFPFTGMAQGDMCVIIVCNRGSAAPTPPAGWTLLTPATQPTSGNTYFIFWKVLSAADIVATSATFTGLSGGFYDAWTFAYTGPLSCAIVANNNSGAGASITVNGFTRNAAGRGYVWFIYDTEAYSALPTATLTSNPYGLTQRLLTWMGSGFGVGIWDLIDPTTYVDGGTQVIGGWKTVNPQNAVVLEFT